MSDNRAMLFDAVDRPFAHLQEQGAAGWSDELAELGFDQLFVSEADGGFGGDWEDALIILKQLGRYGIAAPLAETLAGAWLLTRAGHAAQIGPFGLAQGFRGSAELKADATAILTGELLSVSWTGQVTQILVEVEKDDQHHVALVPGSEAPAAGSHEPTEVPTDVALDQIEAVILPGDSCVGPYLLGALIRVGVAAGALNHILELSVTHANDRIQFGKPIGKFQAIQQNLAVLAGEVAAANCAAAAACRAMSHGDASFEIAAAKLRVNRAIAQATAIAHQTHGAIGVTREHQLHKATQQLWRWRQDFGNDRYWARWLGQAFKARGGRGLWEDLTARSDR